VKHSLYFIYYLLKKIKKTLFFYKFSIPILIIFQVSETDVSEGLGIEVATTFRYSIPKFLPILSIVSAWYRHPKVSSIDTSRYLPNTSHGAVRDNLIGIRFRKLPSNSPTN